MAKTDDKLKIHISLLSKIREIKKNTQNTKADPRFLLRLIEDIAEETEIKISELIDIETQKVFGD